MVDAKDLEKVFEKIEKHINIFRKSWEKSDPRLDEVEKLKNNISLFFDEYITKRRKKNDERNR